MSVSPATAAVLLRTATISPRTAACLNETLAHEQLVSRSSRQSAQISRAKPHESRDEENGTRERARARRGKPVWRTVHMSTRCAFCFLSYNLHVQCKAAICFVHFSSLQLHPLGSFIFYLRTKDALRDSRTCNRTCNSVSTLRASLLHSAVHQSLPCSERTPSGLKFVLKAKDGSQRKERGEPKKREGRKGKREGSGRGEEIQGRGRER